MQEKIANFWGQAQGEVRTLFAKIKKHGLTGLRKVIQEQGPVLWSKGQEQVKGAWQWVTAKIGAVPWSRQALVHVAVGLAAVSLWLVFKTVSGAMAAALALTMVVAYVALIVAFLAFAGVSVIFSTVKSAETAVK